MDSLNQAKEILLKEENKRTFMVGGISTVVILIGSVIISVGSGSEARILLESMLPSVRFLCSAVMTSSATILTLMLTMLSISHSHDESFKKDYFDRVAQLAKLSTITFVGATVFLLLLSVPISESQDVPEHWFRIIYYVTLVGSAALGGGLVSVILMLLNAINGLISLVHPDRESSFIHHQQE